MADQSDKGQAHRVLIPAPAVVGRAVAERFYLPQLDGLRFFAFLTVFLDHGVEGTERLWLAQLQPLGSFGVDLFFVLSSYLLTTLLLREQAATGRIDVVAFLIRRGLRIWPLYLVCVAVIAVGTSLSWWYLLGLATFTFNWQLVVPFAGSLALLEAMGSLWSLSVEEQFYGAWPLLLRLGATPRRVLWLAALMLAGAVIARAAVVLLGLGWGAIRFSSITRLDGMAVGAALAAWPRPSRLPAWAAPVAGIITLGLLSAMQILVPFSASPPAFEILRGLVAAGMLGGLLWVVVHASAGVLASRPLVYLGRISYGLYVFHGAMYALTHWAGLRWQSRLPVAFLLTLAVAALSYRYLERPFLRLKQRYARVESAPV